MVLIFNIYMYIIQLSLVICKELLICQYSTVLSIGFHDQLKKKEVQHCIKLVIWTIRDSYRKYNSSPDLFSMKICPWNVQDVIHM